MNGFHGKLSRNFVLRLITGIAFGVIFWCVYLFLPPFCFTVLLSLILAVIIIFEWKNFYHPHTIWYWLYLPVYPLLPFLLIMYLNHIPAYRDLLLYLFILAFAHDTGSYIMGNFFGKHKIWPTISPKKTWEGFLGGVFFSLVGMRLTLWEKGCKGCDWTFIFFFTLVSCILLFLGDIIESKLKRRAGIKDSGMSLPGHGGFLDRFDGILFAAFFFYFFRHWLVTMLV